MTDPTPSAPPPSTSAASAPPPAATTTVVRRRTEERRPPVLINLLALVVDAVVVGAVLLLLNDAAIRDSVFAVGVTQGGKSTAQPLLDRGFLQVVLPWLNGVLVFAFVVRALGRLAGRGGVTRLLALLARLAGVAIIVYMLRQPVIVTTPHGATAPFGGGSLQAFAEFWGRAALIVALVLTSLGALAGLVALLRRREQSA